MHIIRYKCPHTIHKHQIHLAVYPRFDIASGKKDVSISIETYLCKYKMPKNFCQIYAFVVTGHSDNFNGIIFDSEFYITGKRLQDRGERKETYKY